MACEGNTCGTGGWGGPLPGDPDNDSITLSATPGFGGINLSWNYPVTNPFAVAHVMIYRGLFNNVNTATLLTKMAGTFYYDKVEPNIIYFYWIRTVSINGTTGDYIGPASAYARSTADGIMEELTGRIDAGVLAAALKTEIERIPTIDLSVFNEIQNRIAANLALGQVIDGVNTDLVGAITLISSEITARTEGDTALVSAINIIAAGNGSNTAAIIAEQNLRISADAALASQITTVVADVLDNTAAIQNEVTARATAISAETTARNTQYATVGPAISAAVLVETNARAAADSSLSSQITTTESVLNGNIAAAQTTLQTNINTVNGKVTSIGALYTAKVTVNGLIGGFGVYNDGTEVQAGFDVDTFWVGRTGADKVKPFIISGGIVYIDKARIRDADIDTLKIGNNAVTIPAAISGGSAYSTAYRFLNSAGEQRIVEADLVVNYPYDIQVMLVVSWGTRHDGNGGNTVMTVRRNGVDAMTSTDGVVVIDAGQSHTASAILTIPAGTHTFSLWFENTADNGAWWLQNWSMSTMGVMK